MLHVYIDSVLAIHGHWHLYFYTILEGYLNTPHVIFVRILREFSSGISLDTICNNYKSSW